jgi:hypothetical protein
MKPEAQEEKQPVEAELGSAEAGMWMRKEQSRRLLAWGVGHVAMLSK